MAVALKALVYVVFCLALMALSSVCNAQATSEAKPLAEERRQKRQANPPCPSGYIYNEGKGECTNSLLIGGGK
ncbi:hypothetical protein AAVH_22121 [Aphelenchoides avenae]|nr:hypothetical protein AAVH_22121 [Aphelenchus avenae]